MNQNQLQDFKEEIKEHLAETVRVTVNGKIDELRKDFSNYVKEDVAWKVEMEPVRKAFQGGSWMFKFFLGTLKVIAAIGAGIGAIITIYKLTK